MTSRIIAVEPFDFVIFGGAGDLAYRKLLPALYERHLDGQIPTVTRIIGVSRRHMSDAEYRDATRQALNEHAAGGTGDEAVLATFLNRLHFVPVDATAEAGWDDLCTILQEGHERIRAFYLAVGPELFGTICAKIGAKGLITPRTRVIIEKPIGHDLVGMQVSDSSAGVPGAADLASTTISAKRRCRT
jgi:glucose-6-phosphate 1-dehydrogenase